MQMCAKVAFYKAAIFTFCTLSSEEDVYLKTLLSTSPVCCYSEVLRCELELQGTLFLGGCECQKITAECWIHPFRNAASRPWQVVLNLFSGKWEGVDGRMRPGLVTVLSRLIFSLNLAQLVVNWHTKAYTCPSSPVLAWLPLYESGHEHAAAAASVCVCVYK